MTKVVAGNGKRLGLTIGAIFTLVVLVATAVNRHTSAVSRLGNLERDMHSASRRTTKVEDCVESVMIAVKDQLHALEKTMDQRFDKLETDMVRLMSTRPLP